MIIYGVGLLAICTLFGALVGDVLGLAIGVKANVGGVGFAMLLLLLLTEKLKRSGRFVPQSEQGIVFWTAMYIPVVVAMAAQQNVLGAVKGGPMAILAGVLATVVCFALIPVIDRIGLARRTLARAALDHPTGDGAA
ncbi:malonate transporter subunit MadL [Pseudorhodoferax soli]|uniref:Malonate transporter MadL subunit n=1 Tax=Pseudorhodoferax soli TaxID=545864 RepID=A0A368XFR2_9BURK|nr:malonate transporter subunit MadL [Pseudorhodoferax soli]RCW66675.1 malonate transporter MadL subunit [Pseudorhodoferax soli]